MIARVQRSFTLRRLPWLAGVAVLTTLTTVPRPATAQVSPSTASGTGLYVGGALAHPRWEDRVNGIGGGSSGVGLKVYGGWTFTPNLAVEAGVMDLGKRSGAAGTVKGQGVFVDAVGTWPLADQWSAIGRVGLAHGRVRTSAGNDSGSGLKLGLGAQVQLSRQVALRGEWERYRLDVFGDRPSIDQWSLGAKWSF